MAITATALKEHHRKIRERHPEALRLRIHRALSWLVRSEQENVDADVRFILQWIAMNAAYAREFGREEAERSRAKAFLETLVGLDATKQLHQALFQQFTGPIRTLIDNKFTFEPFWTAMRTHDASNRWEDGFASNKKAAFAAVMQGDTTNSSASSSTGSVGFYPASTDTSVKPHDGAGGVSWPTYRQRVIQERIPMLRGLLAEFRPKAVLIHGASAWRTYMVREAFDLPLPAGRIQSFPDRRLVFTNFLLRGFPNTDRDAVVAVLRQWLTR